MVDIRLVHGDDWKGLYINNQLVLEGHNITIMDLFSILSYSYKDEKIKDIHVVEYWCDTDWLEDKGSFPKNFKEVEC